MEDKKHQESSEPPVPRPFRIIHENDSRAETPLVPFLTSRLLEEYVGRLVQFEKSAIVGREETLNLAHLSDLAAFSGSAVGKSPLKIRKSETEKPGEPSQPAPLSLKKGI